MNVPKLREGGGRPGSRFGVVLAAVSAVAALLCAGCHTPPAASAPPIGAGSTSAATAVQLYEAGRSAEGRPIECLVLGRGDDVVLLLGTIHGDEQAGTLLLWRLADHLQDHPGLLHGRRVVLVPTANPDGAAHNTRTNVHGVDLNRNFPAKNRSGTDVSVPAPLSEPESRAIHGLLQRYRPRRIVSLHEPLACVDYDGPGKALAECMSGLCRLPARKLGGRPGSLGSYAGIDLGIPIITLELPREAAGQGAATLWDRYGTSLVAAVTHPEGS